MGKTVTELSLDIAYVTQGYLKLYWRVTLPPGSVTHTIQVQDKCPDEMRHPSLTGWGFLQRANYLFSINLSYC